MQSIRLTSKRQATFPIKLCQELGVKPGDHLILERKNIEGDIAWTLKPKKKCRIQMVCRTKEVCKKQRS